TLLISPPEKVYVAVLLLIVTMFGRTPPPATAIGLVLAPVSLNVTLSLLAKETPVAPVPTLVKFPALVSQALLAAPLQTRALGPPVTCMITLVAALGVASWFTLLASIK